MNLSIAEAKIFMGHFSVKRFAGKCPFYIERTFFGIFFLS